MVAPRNFDSGIRLTWASIPAFPMSVTESPTSSMMWVLPRNPSHPLNGRYTHHVGLLWVFRNIWRGLYLTDPPCKDIGISSSSERNRIPPQREPTSDCAGAEQLLGSFRAGEAQQPYRQWLGHARNTVASSGALDSSQRHKLERDLRLLTNSSTRSYLSESYQPPSELYPRIWRSLLWPKSGLHTP